MTQKILPKLLPVTPLEIFSQQVKGIYDNLRMTDQGLTYIAPQLGGIFGQQSVQTQGIVLEITDFELNGN